MSDFPWPLLFLSVVDGLVGSAHCIGMCGPFVHILNSQSRSVVVNQFFYNISKAISYATVGGLLGYLGDKLNLVLIGNTAATIGGILILVMAVGYIFPALGRRIGYLSLPSFVLSGLGKLMQRNQGGIGVSVTFGLTSALLPCGLLYHAYAFALAVSNPLYSAIIMFAFSLGTMPGLVGFSAISNWLWKKTGRENWQKIMGFIMLFAGLYIIFYRRTIDPSDPESCEFPQL